MIIGGKCGLIKEHILDRKSRGAKYLEFHTEVKSFMSMSYSDFINIREILDREDIICHTVHSPMKNSYGGQCSLSELDKLKQSDNIEILKRTIESASVLSSVKNPIVVIHPSDDFSVKHDRYNYNDLKSNRDIFEEEICKISEITLSLNPDVRLGIENTLPFVIDSKTKDFIIHKGFIYPDFMTDINNMNLNNVGIVLDICHAIGSIRFTNLITCGKSKLTLIDYLENSIENLLLVHLNNIKDLGESIYNHGTPYVYGEDDNDIETLRFIIKYLKDYRYSGYITLEVLEDDYMKAINYSLTKESVDKIIE